MNTLIIFVAATVCTVFVLIGLLDVDYWFYMLLRLVLFSTAIIIGFVKVKLEEGSPLTLIPLAVCLLLYNPFIPVHLGNKQAWVVLNGITIAYYWSFVLFAWFKSNSSSDTHVGLFRSQSSDDPHINAHGLSEQQLYYARVKLSTAFQLSDAQSLKVLDGKKFKGECAICHKSFHYISGKLTLLENQDKIILRLCKPCFEEINTWREALDLPKFSMDPDAYL